MGAVTVAKDKSPAPRTPKYRKQSRPNSADEAFVELNGHRHYLGAYGSPESKQAYHRLLAEWTANGRRLPVAADEVTVTELIAAYWRHAQSYYRKPDGTHTRSVELIKTAMRPLKRLYGNTTVGAFGPLAYKAVRQSMIDAGLRRKTIERYMGLIKQAVRWGVSEELVAPSVYEALRAVRGLSPGRSSAKESIPVKPVPIGDVEAVRGYVPRAVWALIQLQLHTGARPGELMGMRAVDIETAGSVWTYTPGDHKTAHHGKQRVVYLGPKAQAVVKPLLADRPVTSYLFDPADSEMGRRRAVNNRYTKDTYHRCIKRACLLAGVPHWHPHRLRHNAATFIAQEHGIEMARIVLGHSKINTTAIYAEQDEKKAVGLMAKIG